MAVPTTKQLTDAIVADFEGRLGQSLPLLPKAFFRVFAAVFAAALHLLYRYADTVLAGAFSRTASGVATTIGGRRIVPLEERGRFLSVGPRGVGTKARHTVTVPVTTAGAVIPAGALLRYGSTGWLYQVQTAVTLAGTSVVCTIEASGDGQDGDGTGATGTLAVGALVEFLTPPSGMTGKNATVATVVTQGSDPEPVETYRARVVAAEATSANGGALGHYRKWALEAPHVSRAWPYRGTPGVISVYVEVDDQTNGTPTAAQLAAVVAACTYTNDAGTNTQDRKPVWHSVEALPSPVVSLDVRVVGLAGVSDLAATRARIVAALSEYLKGREPWIEGVTTRPRKDFLLATAVQGVVQNTVTIDGGTVGATTMTIGGSTFLDRTLGNGERIQLGAVAWDS